jgi:hypothetical protein
MFEIISSSIWLAVSAAAFAVAVYIMVKYHDELDLGMLPMAFYPLLAATAVLVNSYNLMLVTIAPNVFLLEYTRNLI